MTDCQTLCFDDYDVFGFDLDHTLAKYRLPNVFNLFHDVLAKFLVEEKGYDKCLLEPFEKHKDFCCRGLVLDLPRGNLLKLAEDGTILRATHGSRFMTDEEIKNKYGEDRHWKLFNRLIDKVDNIPGEFRIFENFFDMVGVLMCAKIVDLIDRQSEKPPETYTFWSDVYDGYSYMYNHTNFRANTGGFFPAIKANVSKYAMPCSTDVKDWLRMLKQKNKKVFLMTSSYCDFAALILEYILGADWMDYFDICLTFARKPGFYYAKRDFLALDGFTEKNSVTELEEGKVYSQGNYQTLMKFFSKITEKEEPQVLYFGDSLRSDAFPSKHYANWETILVLEEIEAEGIQGYSVNDIKNREPDGKRAKYIKGPSALEKEYILSGKWGSFFCDDSLESQEDGRQMNTLWGYIARKYADIAIPQMDYIANLQLDHKFEVFNHTDPKQWGFYPGLPRSLVSHPV